MKSTEWIDNKQKKGTKSRFQLKRDEKLAQLRAEYLDAQIDDAIELRY